MPLNISRNQGKITIQYDQEVKRFFCACALFFTITIFQTRTTGLVQRRWWILCLPEASSSLRCKTQLEKLATCAQWLGWAGKLLSIVTNIDKIIRIIIAITGGQPENFNNNRTQQGTGSCLSLGRNPSQVQKQMVYCERRVKKKLNGRRTPTALLVVM